MDRGSKSVKYETEEERREADLLSKRTYANKKILCINCNKHLSQGHRSRHNKTCKPSVDLMI